MNQHDYDMNRRISAWFLRLARHIREMGAEIEPDEREVLVFEAIEEDDEDQFEERKQRIRKNWS